MPFQGAMHDGKGRDSLKTAEGVYDQSLVIRSTMKIWKDWPGNIAIEIDFTRMRFLALALALALALTLTLTLTPNPNPDLVISHCFRSRHHRPRWVVRPLEATHCLGDHTLLVFL